MSDAHCFTQEDWDRARKIMGDGWHGSQTLKTCRIACRVHVICLRTVKIAQAFHDLRVGMQAELDRVTAKVSGLRAENEVLRAGRAIVDWVDAEGQINRLRAACEAMRDELDRLAGVLCEDDVAIVEAICEQADAAIAKAKGGGNG